MAINLDIEEPENPVGASFNASGSWSSDGEPVFVVGFVYRDEEVVYATSQTTDEEGGWSMEFDLPANSDGEWRLHVQDRGGDGDREKIIEVEGTYGKGPKKQTRRKKSPPKKKSSVQRKTKKKAVARGKKKAAAKGSRAARRKKKASRE